MDKNYSEAFSRNIGWLTDLEQLILRDKHIAIAGLGGVGGFYLLTCCRLGIEKFSISDFDIFELGNMNRQVGASYSSIGKSKLETLVSMAKDINPNVQINMYDKIVESNVDSFLENADLYLDGMDFFQVKAREMLFKTAHKLKIPAITAAPIGMGVSYMIFTKDSMSFEDYFQWKDNSDRDKLINFIIGLTPKPYHLSYLVDKKKVDFDNHKGPSTVMACMMCGGVAVTEALKILLCRGSIHVAPYYHQFDAYKQRYKVGRLRWGINGPIQKLKKHYVKYLLNNTKGSDISNENEQQLSLIEKILNIARWAPSGDNTQPWKFDIIDENSFFILIDNPLDGDFYDIGGIPTKKSVGCLLESIILAADAFNYDIEWEIANSKNVERVKVLLLPRKSGDVKRSLADYLLLRSVDRYSYKKILPPPKDLISLKSCITGNYTVEYFIDDKDKKKVIAMNMLATQLRLVLKKPFDTHQKVLNINNDSDFGIPYSATGLSVATQKLTKHVFSNWRLSYFINHYLGGAFFASLELDYLPGKNSAGYLCINGTKSIDKMSTEELITAGQQIQRLWLTATKLGLSLQPCYTPIIMSYYNRNNIEISSNSSHKKKLHQLLKYFSNLGMSENTLFIARFGYPIKTSKPRSTRLELKSMMIKSHTVQIKD